MQLIAHFSFWHINIEHNKRQLIKYGYSDNTQHIDRINSLIRKKFNKPMRL